MNTSDKQRAYWQGLVQRWRDSGLAQRVSGAWVLG